MLDDSSFLLTVDPRLALPFQQGFTESIQLVFLTGAGVMALAFVVAFFIKEIPLRMHSAAQAAALAEKEG
ncbi:hypothetical protein ACFQV2_37590 [Actinokineospora soli]|uniref:MFS transporter, DHA2 family, multidrug resistance protein n=1 Tax=Actinokineospora soli TaxID=1048753 RepID=A0ABW2TWJ9_9PSEU